jgi:glycosyltransferase involved in cell wall biosynthesis
VKIAIVTLRYDAPGGVENNVRALSGWLRRAGHEVTIYASDLFDEAQWDRRTGWAPVVDGIPVRRFTVTKRLVPGLTMPMMTGLVDALVEDDPDVIHAHSHRYGHVLEAAAVARRRGIPLAVSTHYHPADPGEPWHKAQLLRVQDHLFGLTAYRAADGLIVETDLERRQVGEFAPADRVTKIPPGLHREFWLSEERDPFPAGLPEAYLLFTGRIAANKGVEHLLDALALLPPDERPRTVLMGKDWGRRAELEAQARRLGIEGSLTWLGHVPDGGAYRSVMRNARAFVLPSVYEAFGIVLIEAMLCGVPVVGTAVGGIPEVLDHGRRGRLVPSENPRALAEAIRAAMVRSPETEQLAAAARPYAATLDWSVAAKAHLELFERLRTGR